MSATGTLSTDGADASMTTAAIVFDTMSFFSHASLSLPLQNQTNKTISTRNLGPFRTLATREPKMNQRWAEGIITDG